MTAHGRRALLAPGRFHASCVGSQGFVVSGGSYPDPGPYLFRPSIQRAFPSTRITAPAIIINTWLTLVAITRIALFGLLLVMVIPTLGVVLGVRALDAGSSTSAGNVALGIAVNTITASFTALATALLYFDLLARQEQTRAVHEAVRPTSLAVGGSEE